MAKLCLAGHFKNQDTKQKWYETGREYFTGGVLHIAHVRKAIRALGYYFFRGDLEYGVESLAHDNARRAKKIYEAIIRKLELSERLQQDVWRQIVDACKWRSQDSKISEAYRKANEDRSQTAKQKILAACQQLIAEGKKVGVNAVRRLTGSNKAVISKVIRSSSPVVHANRNRCSNSSVVVEKSFRSEQLGVDRLIWFANKKLDQSGPTPIAKPIKEPFSLEPLKPVADQEVELQIANIKDNRLAAIVERCKNMAKLL